MYRCIGWNVAPSCFKAFWWVSQSRRPLSGCVWATYARLGGRDRMSASCAYRAAHADGPMAMTSSESSHVIPANALARVTVCIGVVSSQWQIQRHHATCCLTDTMIAAKLRRRKARCMLTIKLLTIGCWLMLANGEARCNHLTSMRSPKQ